MNLKQFLILLLIAVGFVSCNNLVAPSQVSRAEVKEMVNDSETLLVDVRIPKEFAEKTVDGAINIPLATIEDNLELFKNKKQIIVFCNSGRQSNLAIELLKKKGITNVYNGKNVQNVEAIKNEQK